MWKLETVEYSFRLTTQWKSKRSVLGALRKLPKAIISQFKMFVNNTGIKYSFSHHAVPVHPSVLPEKYFEGSCCELNKYIYFWGLFTAGTVPCLGSQQGPTELCQCNSGASEPW